MNEAGTLAQYVDYRRLAVQKSRVSGTLPVSQLPRVSAEMQRAPGDSDTVDVDLAFREDAQRRVRVQGRIEAVLALCCQRCLNVYEQPVAAEVAGVVVGDDAAAAGVPRDDEPIEARGDILDLWALIGDEVLLALPVVGRCNRPACQARYEADQREDVPGDTGQRTDNPFAVLSTLKRDD